MRTRSALPVLIALVLLASGCVAVPSPSGSPSTPSSKGTPSPSTATTTSDASPGAPSPAPSIDLSGLDDATATAIRIRASFGLRLDLDYIRRVAADPDATSEFGTPLLPSEIQEIENRSARADAIVPIVQGYASANSAVFGGIWLDQARGGVVTVSFTDDLDRHRTALAALLKGQGVVNVVHARYAESVMRAVQDRIAADDAWFRTIPAMLRGVGYDVIANRVTIDVSTANPRIAALIVRRYGIPEDALQVNSDGTGVALEPWGVIHVRIADVPAGVRAELTLQYHSDRPGADCGRGDVGIGFEADGTTDLPCQGGHWEITAGRNADDLVARGEVDLAPGGTATVTLRPIAP
jgi:hypothetical protein